MSAITITRGAQSALDQLKAEGVAYTDADVIQINAICSEIETPETRKQLARGTPHHLCGDIWLWPLTIAGYDWLERSGYDMPDHNLAMAYAMAHGHNPDIATATWNQVKVWKRKLTVTTGQLVAVVEDVLNQSLRARYIGLQSDDAPSLGDYVVAAMQAYGGTPEQWQCAVALNFISDIIHAATSQVAAGDSEAVKLMATENQLALAQKLWEIEKRGKA